MGLWLIGEEEPFFRRDLPLSPDEEQELAQLKGLRRAEWLASRWLLHHITGQPQRMPLAKNAFSKPFFLDQPDLYCSLSHSHGVVGALLADRNCGCDVQVLVEKMPRLAPKFVHEEEARFVAGYGAQAQFDLWHLMWTAKESLYKAYGLKELDFRRDMRVEPFEWNGCQASAGGWVRKGDFGQRYGLNFFKSTLREGEGAYVCATCFEEASSGHALSACLDLSRL